VYELLPGTVSGLQCTCSTKQTVYSVLYCTLLCQVVHGVSLHARLLKFCK